MEFISKLLEHETVAAALISTIGAVLLALIAWVSGAGKWIAGEISKELAERRARARQSPRLPKRTLHVVAEGGLFPQSWSRHDFGNGRSATDCRTFLLITNLTQMPVRPVRAEVRLRGLSRFRRRPYEIHLSSPSSRYGEVVPAGTTAKWHLSFYVLPELEEGYLDVDVLIYDQFDNQHRAKKIRFRNQGEGSLPW